MRTKRAVAHMARGDIMASRTFMGSLSRLSALGMSPTPDRESSLPDKQIFATVTSAVIVGVGYYLGTRVGFALTPSGQPNSAFWPPNAFLLAALLLARRRVWWTLFIAVIPAH